MEILKKILDKTGADRVIICTVTSPYKSFSGITLYQINLVKVVSTELAKKSLSDYEILNKNYSYFLFLEFLTTIFTKGFASYTSGQNNNFKSSNGPLEYASVDLKVKKFHNIRITDKSFISLHLNHTCQLPDLDKEIRALYNLV